MLAGRLSLVLAGVSGAAASLFGKLAGQQTTWAAQLLCYAFLILVRLLQVSCQLQRKTRQQRARAYNLPSWAAGQCRHDGPVHQRPAARVLFAGDRHQRISQHVRLSCCIIELQCACMPCCSSQGANEHSLSLIYCCSSAASSFVTGQLGQMVFGEHLDLQWWLGASAILAGNSFRAQVLLYFEVSPNANFSQSSTVLPFQFPVAASCAGTLLLQSPQQQQQQQGPKQEAATVQLQHLPAPQAGGGAAAGKDTAGPHPPPPPQQQIAEAAAAATASMRRRR